MFPRSRQLIYPLNSGRRLRHIGAKAQQLRFLVNLGVLVPATFVCPWDVHAHYQAGETDLLERISAELAVKLDPARSWAVRSSASVEDEAGHSFAGQFTSLLDVSGIDDLVRAIQYVWDSASAPSLQPYLERIELNDAPKMSVIVQEMIQPVLSGVAFSKNPVTGMDEVIVEAVEGLGTALMQEGCTPRRWVNKWGKWTIEPPGSSVDRTVIQEVVHRTVRIARAFGRPVDLEWVYDGQDVYWVQLRPITNLEGVSVYSNRIAREVMPGIIKPLVWSVNVALVNGAWIRVLEELVGATGLQPDDLAKAFYHRAYFNMGAIGRIFVALGMPQETLELLMGVEGGEDRPRFKPSLRIVGHMPRLARFVASKLRFDREIESFLPAAQEINQRFASHSLDELDEEGLLEEIDRLFASNQRLAYTNVVGPLLMYAYNALLRGQLARVGVELERFDVMRGQADGQAYDPVVELGELHRQYQALDEAVQQRLRVGGSGALAILPRQEPFRRSFASLMARFGHYSSSGNDFSQVPWREQPDLVMQMIMDFCAPGGVTDGISWDDLPSSVQQRHLLRFAFRRARQYRRYREAINYQYTFGYGLFRNYFLALGARLVHRGLLSGPEDVFYLSWDEARGLVEAGADAQPAIDLVAQRRESVLAARDVMLPDIIYGDQPPPVETATQVTKRLSGVPTSRGYYQGRVRVIESVEQFDQVEPGHVIVIPYSDVSWTPVIARAGAVVAESGGILSHSSIVAREYNLPAVVSVTGACHLLADHMLVTVDGFKGEIVIHDNETEGG